MYSFYISKQIQHIIEINVLSDMYLIRWLRHIVKQKFKYHDTSKPSALYFKIAKAHWQISVLYIIYSYKHRFVQFISELYHKK